VISLSGVSLFLKQRSVLVKNKAPKLFIWCVCCAIKIWVFSNACGGADTPSGARLWGIGVVKIKLKKTCTHPKSVQLKF